MTNLLTFEREKLLTAVFSGHAGFVVLAALLTLGSGLVSYRMAKPRTENPTVYALWIASTVSVVTLTMWTTGGSALPDCVLNQEVLEPFRTTQGMLNSGMFIPFGLLGAAATRRPVLVLISGVLLSAGIEVAQAALPFVGRLCDSSDFAANSAGVVAGAAAGAVLTAPSRNKKPLSSRHKLYALAAVGAVISLISASWGLWVNPVVMERTVTDMAASDEQREAVSAAVQEAFGGEYSVTSATYTPAEERSGTIMAHLSSGAGSGSGAAEINWPDLKRFNVNLIPSRVEKGHSFPVPGAGGPARTEEDAGLIATKYAEAFTPWGLRNSVMTVEPVDDDISLGWLVSWRRWQGDVLLPMRLDVMIEPSGNLTDLITRNIEDPELPPVKVSEEEAWSLVQEHFAVEPGETERSEPVLLAAERDGDWRVHWLLNVVAEYRHYSATVDATTGTIHAPEERELPQQ